MNLLMKGAALAPPFSCTTIYSSDVYSPRPPDIRVRLLPTKPPVHFTTEQPGRDTPPNSVIECPDLQEYIVEFGNRKHDKALVAEIQGNVVGAIWVRIMNDYGHIDNDTPSLAMSVCPQYRGLGIGTSLLKQLLQDSCKEPKSKVCTKRDTSLQSKYTSRVKALIKTYVEIERKYPK